MYLQTPKIIYIHIYIYVSDFTNTFLLSLFDNIFTNAVNESLVSGNLTFLISDHLVQFFIYPELTLNNKEKKSQY